MALSNLEYHEATSKCCAFLQIFLMVTSYDRASMVLTVTQQKVAMGITSAHARRNLPPVHVFLSLGLKHQYQSCPSSHLEVMVGDRVRSVGTFSKLHVNFQAHFCSCHGITSCIIMTLFGTAKGSNLNQDTVCKILSKYYSSYSANMA